MRLNEEIDFLTVQEVSSLLKLTDLTIYKYIKEGELEAVEFGGYYRIKKQSLDSFINSHKVVGKEKEYGSE